MNKERKEFLHNIFTTAIEGGIGYWAACEAYHWSLPGADWPDDGDLDGFFADIVDFEDNNKKYIINRWVILNGLAKIRAGGVSINKTGLGIILTGDATNDAGDIDAEWADCIVQVGLFGKIIYG